MSEIPGDLKFQKSHEWVRVEQDGTVTVGISDHAQSSLGDLVYVELPEVGMSVQAGHGTAVVESVKAASDLTNELLKNNAENLQTANAVVRRQVERGVFDIETVKEANAKLVATINESLQIADEGKRKRAEAEQQLKTMEAELRKTLAAASARAQGSATPAARA